METEQQQLTRRSLEGSLVDWKLCLFCLKSKCKGSKQLINLCTRKAEESLRKAADILNDDAMKMKIGLPDLIAQEAKYHKAYHQLYMENARKFPTKDKEETIYEKAFASFTSYIEKKLLQECRAREMKQLLEGSISDNFSRGRSGALNEELSETSYNKLEIYHD